MSMFSYLVIFLTAILISIASCLVCIRLARRFSLIDTPRADTHKHHENPTPLAGGMTIILALGLTTILHHDWLSLQYLGLFSSALIVFLFGLWDDAVHLPFWAKLIGQILAGVTLIASGISVHILKIPGLEWLNWGITLFWVIGIVNGSNFIDSADHLSTGIAITMFFSLLVGTLLAGQQDLAQLLTILLGIVLVLYVFNTSPAATFLGDSGAQLLGLFAAVIAIQFTPVNAPQTVTWIAPILIAGLPIFDTSLVVFSRARRRKRVYRAGLDHTWHRLVAFGIPGSQAVHIMHLASLLLGCLALITLELPLTFGVIILAATLAIGLAFILFLDSRRRWQ